MNKAMLLLPVLAVMALSGCIQGDVSSISGSLDVIAPGYYTQLKIDNAGYMNMTKDVGTIHQSESRLMDSAELSALKSKVSGSDFFGLKDSYVDWSVDNGTTYILKLNLGNQTNEVTCYGECPESMTGIIGMIEGYWGDKI